MTNNPSPFNSSENFEPDNLVTDVYRSISPNSSKNQGFSLQRYLFLTLIPTIIAPLSIATLVGYQSIRQNSKEQLKQQLKDEALLAEQTVRLAIERAVTIPISVASNPAILEAVRSNAKQVESKQLTELPIAGVESNYAASKLVQPNSGLNYYLQQTAKSSGLGEILITDQYGFNVAYSQSPSDLIQRDETWWQKAKTANGYIDKLSVDPSTNELSIPIVEKIADPRSGAFLGVIKASLPVKTLTELEANYLENSKLSGSQQVQSIDIEQKQVLNTFSNEGKIEREIIGGEAIAEIGMILKSLIDSEEITTESIINRLPDNLKLKQLEVNQIELITGQNLPSISFIYAARHYVLTPISNTTLLISASIDYQEISSAGNRVLLPFLGITIALAVLTGIVVSILARQIVNPLKELALKAELVAAGDLNVLVTPTGNRETRTLANSFNNVVQKVKELIQQQENSLREIEIARNQAEELAQEQRQKNQSIQRELLRLLGDVEGASSGDLTVRAQIDEGEIGIVADFFNSIIENLREIVTQVKEATERVNSSVGNNRMAIADLTAETDRQAEQITQTLNSIEQMTASIRKVAHNAKAASKIARIASDKVEAGEENIDRTVLGIVKLQETIDETATKVRRLGDASQQISRVISLIDRIAMQTNLLAINASIEAARAGKEGRGFAVVAEEVGGLAIQSAEATKEVETIVATIQQEIARVVEMMEVGTTQAEEGTRLVQESRDSLAQIVEVSQQIDSLVQIISQATISQSQTSATVTQLMEQISQLSERTSNASREVSLSLETTVAIAENLQSSVNTFKVEA